jgi:steroid 5-alpha reductase family enzyme
MIPQLLLVNLTAVLVYMSLWFVVGWRRQKLNTVDVAWGTGFALVAWLVVLQQSTARNILIAVLVSIWAARLTSHLARRVFGGEEDSRYKELSSKWHGNFWLRAYLSIFILQGVLVWVISLPVVMAAGPQSEDLAVLSVLGAGLWVIGFGLEATADRQLRQFVNDKTDKSQVMDQGLWRYSRHPNYFGEMLQWWAIGIIALQVQWGWLGLIGPATLTFLLLFVSGVPLVENSKKKDSAYRDYMRRTSIIVPLPPKKL